MKNTRRRGFVLSDALIGLVLIGLGVLTFVGMHQLMSQQSHKKQLQVYHLRQKYETLIPASDPNTKQKKSTNQEKKAKKTKTSESSSSLNDPKNSASQARPNQPEASRQSQSQPENDSKTSESIIARLPDEPSRQKSEHA
ncbi:type IV pilus modification PilV family protein [Secundilactobacillus collinoides]|uniref:Uncharacterized protein n=1 Tax=Secundilactobacillus collinoides TaxID=33960 RepID=A0A166G2J1_SECCO|nr:hypothetical protein [Secundilactobacillus collinoides]KZL36671.1 hypothetical protein TY91_13850 [Secundilactobacillus collinoides]